MSLLSEEQQAIGDWNFSEIKWFDYSSILRWTATVIQGTTRYKRRFFADNYTNTNTEGAEYDIVAPYNGFRPKLII